MESGPASRAASPAPAATYRGGPPLFPPPPPPPPAEYVSRYRSLRGKSVSSTNVNRKFDVFRDENTAESTTSSRANSGTTSASSSWGHRFDLDVTDPDSPTRQKRRRSKSVTGRLGEKLATTSASALVLSPKPINVLLAARGKNKSANNLAAPSTPRSQTATRDGTWSHAVRPPMLPSSPPPPIDLASLQALNRRFVQQNKAAVSCAAAVAISVSGSAAGSATASISSASGRKRSSTSPSTAPSFSTGTGRQSPTSPIGNKQGSDVSNRETSTTKTASSSEDPDILDSGKTTPGVETAASGQTESPKAPQPRPAGLSQPKPEQTPSNTDLRDEEEARWAAEVARLEAETDRILAEQKKRDLARRQAQLATPPPKPKSLLIFDKFTFLTRSGRKHHNAGGWSQPSTPSTIASTVFSLEASPVSSIEAISPAYEKMSFIEPGGRGIVPQTDAPTSAINGGERRVTVRCLSSTISLPVTAETSPIDIIYSAANLMAHQVNPETSIVVECFVILGLERRLRRYESVRDVTNSWDRDQQNSLLILSYNSRQQDRDLDLANVSRTVVAPTGFTFQLYHSSRPGKWMKRWITLMDNGQIYAAKKQDGGLTDKDSSPLCHLSDFDIYTPRESEMRRTLKPPKQFCYAIKSQQKTVVFPNGENFVHFFSTDDEKLAKRFHDLVHGWRSWYLVNKQGALQKKPQPLKPTKSHIKTKSMAKSGNHRLQVSVDETPYTIGQFQPLVDMKRFDKPIEDFGKDFEKEKLPPLPPAPVAEQMKTLSKPKVLTKANTAPVPAPKTPKGEAEFASKGLLGEAYEKRKQTGDAPAPTVHKVEGPFTEGPSLLNGGTTASPTVQEPEKPEASSWFPSAVEHTARKRSQSIRSVRRPATADAAAAARKANQPAPLLCIAKDFPPPPSMRWREGHGHGVKAPNGAPLINLATGGPSASSSTSTLGSPRIGPNGPGPGMSHRPPPGRQRSRSTASQHGSRRPGDMDEKPPMPPMPNRSGRREGAFPPAAESSRCREARTREPLVNRAK